MLKHYMRCLLFVLAVLGGQGRSAQAQVDAITEIEVGFDGTYRAGKWTPVWVAVEADIVGDDADIEIMTPDGDGVAAVYSSLNQSAHDPVRRLVYARFGRSPTWLTVNVRDGEKLIAARTFPAGSFPAPQPASREVVLSLSPMLDIESATDLNRRRGDDAYLACRQTDTASLPDRWFGYDSADTIVLTTSDSKYLDGWSDAQVDALFDWVTHGGKLIVSGSDELPDRWQRLYPGETTGTQPLRRTTALEVFAGAAQRLDLVKGGRFEMPVTVFSAYDGRPLLTDQIAGQSEPLFVLHPRGFGMIVYSSLDLTAEPIASWADRPRLLARLLRMGEEAEAAAGDTQQSGGRVTHIGYKDLSGQLRAALEEFRFGGRSLIPFSWVAVLIVGYIVLIGPADYFILRRLGRMELTWITFPVIAIALAGVAVLLTGYYKGDRFAARQLAVIDHDIASGRQRKMLWAHVYSPDNARYEISMTGEGNHLLAWHGLSGSALGGMRTPATTVNDEVLYRYRFDAANEEFHAEPVGVPINIWSTKSLYGYQWSRSAAPSQPNLVEIVDRRLSGQFTNTTGYQLTDCQLLYDRWAYSIRGTLAPGDLVHLADEGDPRDLEWKMTRRVVSEDNKAVSTPWNPIGRDVDRIAEVMMFHRAAGGAKYTDLAHRQMESLDLSRHLKMGRAVLLGRLTGDASQESGAQLSVDGEPVVPEEDGNWTFVRMIIPVARRNE